MGAYPYLDDLNVTYGDSADSVGAYLTVSYSTIPLIDSIADAEQLEVLWFSPALTDVNGALIPTTSLDAADIFSSGVIPSTTYLVDPMAKTITIDQTAVQSTAFITSDGEPLYRAKVEPSDSNVLTVQRSTPIGSKLVEFAAGSRITPGQLNLSDDQLFYKLQELTKQADDLFGIATVTGIIDDGEDVTNLSELTDVTLTPLNDGDALFWTGAYWTNGGISIGTLTDVADSLTETPGFVLTWDGSQWISAAPTGDGNIYVNSVNGETGTVVLTTSDLANDAGYITEPDIPQNISYYNNDSQYITVDTAPVTSVNGETGDVVIDVPENLNDLDDVQAIAPVMGQALRWDSNSRQWKPGGAGVVTPETMPLPFIFQLDESTFDINEIDNFSKIVPSSPMHNGGPAIGSVLDLGYREYFQRSLSTDPDAGYYPVKRIAIDFPGHLRDAGVPPYGDNPNTSNNWQRVGYIPTTILDSIPGLSSLYRGSFSSTMYTTPMAMMQSVVPSTAALGDVALASPVASAGVNENEVDWTDYLIRWDGTSPELATNYGDDSRWRIAEDVDSDGELEFGDFMFKGPYGAFLKGATASQSIARTTINGTEVYSVSTPNPTSWQGAMSTDALADPSTLTTPYWQSALPNGVEVRTYPLYTEREQTYHRQTYDFMDFSVPPSLSP